jgi:hypothetical protein
MSTKAQVKTPAKTPAAPAAARIIQPPVGVPEHEADRPDIAAQLEGAARLGHSLGAISVDSYRRPIIQRQETTAEEEDAPELKPGPAAIQRQEIPEEEEEELQLKPGPAAIQRQEIPEEEEEELQMMRAPAEQVALQRQELPEEKEELMMTRDDQRVGPQGGPVAPDVEAAIQRATGGAASEVRQENRTGLPDELKAGIEHLSGLSLDHVRVHYHSSKPAELQALAYTQGTDIHVGPGQETHLPHEAWHVLQQKQGRVKPTMQVNGASVNDDVRLEREADVMGAKAKQMKGVENQLLKSSEITSAIIQCKPESERCKSVAEVKQACDEFEQQAKSVQSESTYEQKYASMLNSIRSTAHPMFWEKFKKTRHYFKAVDDGVTRGVMLAEVKNGEVHIANVVGISGGGAALVNAAKDLARELGAKVTLEAADVGVAEYYKKKHGFEFSQKGQTVGSMTFAF